MYAVDEQADWESKRAIASFTVLRCFAFLISHHAPGSP